MSFTVKTIKIFQQRSDVLWSNKFLSNRENACARCKEIHTGKHMHTLTIHIYIWMWYQAICIIICALINKTWSRLHVNIVIHMSSTCFISFSRSFIQKIKLKRDNNQNGFCVPKTYFLNYSKLLCIYSSRN